jgi:hypothetical protein
MGKESSFVVSSDFARLVFGLAGEMSRNRKKGNEPVKIRLRAGKTA